MARQRSWTVRGHMFLYYDVHYKQSTSHHMQLVCYLDCGSTVLFFCSAMPTITHVIEWLHVSIALNSPLHVLMDHTSQPLSGSSEALQLTLRCFFLSSSLTPNNTLFVKWEPVILSEGLLSCFWLSCVSCFSPIVSVPHECPWTLCTVFFSQPIDSLE